MLEVAILLTQKILSNLINIYFFGCLSRIHIGQAPKVSPTKARQHGHDCPQ